MQILKKLLISAAVVFTSTVAFAQTSPPQTSVKLFFEKVFIHTDRAVYAAGEDFWFKTYVTNGQDNHLIRHQ